MSIILIFNSVLLGFALAMDAFSVSIANGLAEPAMSHRKMYIIAGCYGFFQWFMPMTGWFCVHTIASLFSAFQKFIPWIALLLLLYIGGKMLIEGIRDSREKKDAAADSEEILKGSSQASHNSENTADAGHRLTGGALLIQGIATSIDALSVGFTISEYNALEAFGSSLIIAVVTFLICMAGLLFGRRFGERLAGKATILGGIILIGIGIEIWLTGILGI